MTMGDLRAHRWMSDLNFLTPLCDSCSAIRERVFTRLVTVTGLKAIVFTCRRN